MKLKKLLAVLMLSVFCLSGCSNKFDEMVEMEQKAEQNTTTVFETSGSEKESETEETAETIPMLDMSEKWKVIIGGEINVKGSAFTCDTYGFMNESGYIFACSVFMPKGAKDGEKYPVVLMNNGLQISQEMLDLDGTGEAKEYMCVESDSNKLESLLADGLNKKDIGLIVIEPLGSYAAYGTLWGVQQNSDDPSSADDAKGWYYQNTYDVDKAYMDVVLDNLGEINGADPSNVILASRDFHNIAVTQSAVKNKEKIKGLVMLDPCTDLIEKIRKEYPDKEELKDVEDTKAVMAPDYMYELYDLDLKAESDKLNIDTKVFISKEKMKTDISVPENDRGIVNGTLATKESAEKCYPNSAPEILDTTDFIYTSQPSDKTVSSIKKVVSYCDEFLKK